MIDLLTVATSLAVGVALLLAWGLYKSTLLPTGFPPGPPRTPLLGNIKLIAKNRQSRHERLTAISKSYGAIFGMKLVTLPAVVLNDVNVMREAFLNNGDCLGKPEMMPGMNKLLSKNGMRRGIIQNGDRWWTNRKFTEPALTPRGVGNRSNVDRIREEIEALCKEIKKHLNSPVSMSTFTERSGYNVLCSIFFGSRFQYSDSKFSDFLHAASDYLNPESVSSIVNFFPRLEVFMGRNWLKNVLDKVGKADEIIANEIEEHQMDFRQDKVEDFIDYYLNENPKGTKDEIDLDDFGRCLMDCFGGATSVFATLNWLLFFLAKYPEIQNKCYEEINKVKGKQDPEMADKDEMTYVCATINEAMRHSPAAPFGVSCQTLKDTKIAGYNVPKKTLVIPNLYAVHHDPKYWDDPSAFYPERWIAPDGTLKKHKSFIPYGIGRRQCLGIKLAEAELFLYFTTLVKKFQFEFSDPENAPSLQGIYVLTLNPQKHELIIKNRMD